MSSEETTTFEFRLPDPGEGLTEAELTQWFVAAGDHIAEDDPVCEVETDKALVEIPSPCDGTVARLRFDPGDVMAVGAVIAEIETNDPPRQTTLEKREAEPLPETAEGATERTAAATAVVDELDDEDGRDASRDAPAGVESDRDGEPSEESVDDDRREGDRSIEERGRDRVFATPSTRKFARRRDVDITTIRGSGVGGRVTRSDVEDALGHPSPSADSEPEPRQAGASEAVEDADEEGPVVRRPIRGMRKRIAEKMVRSKTVIPHVTQGFEADARQLVALKERLDEKHDVHVTYTPLIVKAIVPALEAFPVFNATVDDEGSEIVEKRYYNVGVATETADGVMVPVVRNVDRKSLVEVAEELHSLVERGRDRTIAPKDLGGGSFTLTNVGGQAGGHGTFGTPVINHPQTAILGVGAIQNKPVAVSDDEMEVQKRIRLTLSFDHRVADGVTSSQFMGTIIRSLEDPDVLLARL